MDIKCSNILQLFVVELGVVSSGRDIAACAGPIGVHEFARSGEELVCVGTEVISLGLQEVRG